MSFFFSVTRCLSLTWASRYLTHEMFRNLSTNQTNEEK